MSKAIDAEPVDIRALENDRAMGEHRTGDVQAPGSERNRLFAGTHT